MKRIGEFFFLHILTFILTVCFFNPSFCSSLSSSSAHQMVLLSGNANIPLAREVAKYLDISLGDAQVKRFNDGEIQISIEENVRGMPVFILQSTCPSDKQSINDNLMELYLMIRTVKRAAAASVTAVIPYYGYARQDRKSSACSPISAADIAFLLEDSGVEHVITVDLHCGQIQGFFRNTPVDNLCAATLFAPYFAKKQLSNVVVVSPDAGGVERANKFIEGLKKQGMEAQLAIISKQRICAGVIDAMKLIGDVKERDAIIVDDLCDTAGTLVQAAQLLRECGAQRIFAAVTHPVFSGSALDRIQKSVIEEMVIADTIPLKKGAAPKVKSISIAPLIAESIQSVLRKGQAMPISR